MHETKTMRRTGTKRTNTMMTKNFRTKFGDGKGGVILASGSLDLVDLHGVGRPDWYHQGPVKGRISIRYHPIPLARPIEPSRKEIHLLASLC